MITLLIAILAIIAVIVIAGIIMLVVGGLLVLWPLVLIVAVFIAVDCLVVSAIVKSIKNKRASK